MNLKRRSLAVAATAILGSVATLSSCSSDDSFRVHLCPDDTVSVDVYNYFPGSEFADVHTVDDPEELDYYCAHFPGWGDISVEETAYDPDAHTERAVTVMVMHSGTGDDRTVWVHRQPRYMAPDFITTSDGTQYKASTQHIDAYYLPQAQPISRSEVPEIPKG